MKNINHIIQLCQQGDQKAQRTLYEMFRVRWFMLAMRYGKNKMQAEDIFQEGLIQIFKDLHQFDHKKGAFSTWSSRVMVNTALRYLKKFNWIEAFKPISEIDHWENQEESIYQQLAAEELTQLIQNLPLGYRLVFNMYVIEGYKHQEIAAHLGISIGTSKSQLSKARKELRNQIELQLTDRKSLD